MKAFRLIGMALVAMCLCMNFVSCSNEDVVAPEDPQEEKYVTVGLGCTGEFLEFSESAMGRAATDELYGIEVYSLEEHNMEMEGSIHTYYTETPYAYGMFTSLENVKIRLLQGQKYKFQVGIVIDPFKYNNDYWFEENYNNYYNYNGLEFTYSSDRELQADYMWGTTDRFFHDRYYGQLDIYTPEENKSVNIQTKRVAYGVKYETIGLSTNESFRIEVNQNGSNQSLYSLEVGNEIHDNIYSFYYIRDAWRGLEIWNENMGMWEYKNYTIDKNLTISWKKADGSVIPMGTYTVTFKRNVKTTIRIHAEDLNLENGIKVYKEETPMADDEYIYDITGGKVEEVPVNSGN